MLILYRDFSPCLCYISPMIMVTTPIKPTDRDLLIAEELALKLGYKFIPRGNSSISHLLKRVDGEVACVVKDKEIKVVIDGQNYKFHPNMAKLRLDKLLKGEHDRLLDLSNIEEGDRVLDCTLGMASDTLVFSYAVGESGEVLGIESSPLITELTKRGMELYNDPQIQELGRRVTIVNSDYRDFLKIQRSKSFDVIYFDPMFENTRKRANGLDIIRRLAEYRPLELEDIEEAYRVSRRSIIIKDGADASTLKRLNIPIVSKRKKTTYGRIDL